MCVCLWRSQSCLGLGWSFGCAVTNRSKKGRHKSAMDESGKKKRRRNCPNGRPDEMKMSVFSSHRRWPFSLSSNLHLQSMFA
jgi:hypothetical protein